MARTFANGDKIAYSGVPPVDNLSTLSIVMRMSGNSGCPSYGTAIVLVDSGDGFCSISVGRNDLENNLYFTSADPFVNVPRFPFTFDGVMRSVVCTFDGGAGKKYGAFVGGVSQTVTNQDSNTTTGGTRNTFSVGRDTPYGWVGSIAEVGIYNRVITQAEATMHAAGYSCRNFPRGLIFYAPLIREVNDIAGGLTGTITGTTVSDHPRIYA